MHLPLFFADEIAVGVSKWSRGSNEKFIFFRLAIVYRRRDCEIGVASPPRLNVIRSCSLMCDTLVLEQYSEFHSLAGIFKETSKPKHLGIILFPNFIFFFTHNLVLFHNLLTVLLQQKFIEKNNNKVMPNNKSIGSELLEIPIDLFNSSIYR